MIGKIRHERLNMEIENGIIEIEKLHKFDYTNETERFAYNDASERLAGALAERIVGSKFHDQTIGYDNRHDYYLGPIAIEQKISGGMGLNGRPDGRTDFGVLIEIGKIVKETPESEPKFKTSGLHTTKADAFYTIMPGYSGSTLVGKGRLFSTSILRQTLHDIQERLLDNRETIIREFQEGIIGNTSFKPKGTYYIDSENGTRYVYFNPKTITNIGLFDVAAITEPVVENGVIVGKRIVKYDLNDYELSTKNPREDWNKWLKRIEQYRSL